MAGSKDCRIGCETNILNKFILNYLAKERKFNMCVVFRSLQVLSEASVVISSPGRQKAGLSHSTFRIV